MEQQFRESFFVDVDGHDSDFGFDEYGFIVER
jgi:hypothetical protein